MKTEYKLNENVVFKQQYFDNVEQIKKGKIIEIKNTYFKTLYLIQENDKDHAFWVTVNQILTTI